MKNRVDDYASGAPEEPVRLTEISDLSGLIDLGELTELANAKMPFGKYAGRFLVDLPETYVLWFKGKGYPEGKLGEQFRAIEEIKTNGLEYLLHPLIRR